MSNINVVKPLKQKTIMLDKERHLRFDLNAYAALEDLYGSIEEALHAMEKGSIKAIRAVLWAGLVHEDESLTVKQVGSLISFDNLEYVSTVLGEAIADSMPADIEVSKLNDNMGN